MTIDTTRSKIEMASQMAGHVPAGAEVIGLVSLPRTWSALVRMRTGVYVTMIDHTVRTLDQWIARDAIARASA